MDGHVIRVQGGVIWTGAFRTWTWNSTVDVTHFAFKTAWVWSSPQLAFSNEDQTASCFNTFLNVLSSIISGPCEMWVGTVTPFPRQEFSFSSCFVCLTGMEMLYLWWQGCFYLLYFEVPLAWAITLSTCLFSHRDTQRKCQQSGLVKKQGLFLMWLSEYNLGKQSVGRGHRRVCVWWWWCWGGGLCSFTQRKWTLSPSPHSSSRCLTGKIFSQLEREGRESICFTIHHTGGRANWGKTSKRFLFSVFFFVCVCITWA